MPVLAAVIALFAFCIFISDCRSAHCAEPMREFYRMEYQRYYPVGN